MEEWREAWSLAARAPAGMLLVDVNGTPRLLAANPEAERLLRRSERALRALPAACLPAPPEGLCRDGAECSERRVVCGQPLLIRSRNIGGGLVLCVLMALPAGAAGRPAARRDPLTGLLDRGTFQQRVSAALNGTAGLSAFLMLDLDDFKSVNDTCGHPAGDALLSAVSGKLRSAFRQGDLLGRMGGDEFAVFLRGVPSRDFVQRRAERLLRELARGFPRGEITVTCSAGAAFYPEDGDSFRVLYARADQALYTSKSSGKNRCTLWQKKEE